MIRLGKFKFRTLLALLATLVLLAGLAVSAQAAGAWTATGPMVYGRMLTAAARLSDGRVLVAGGSVSGNGNEAEIFNPATNSWAATGNMSTARWSHTATLLNDGRVLVAGGMFSPIYIDQVYSSAEIFDAVSSTWIATGSMTTGRYAHTATLLTNGRVLVAGGTDLFNNSLASAEIFDPATGTWSPTGSMTTPRSSHTATLLNDGRVLVISGLTAEIYNPATGTWSATGNPTTSGSATLLNDGRVLVAGGGNNSAEIFDPASGIWSATASMINARGGHVATLLNDGRVLVAGGGNSTGILNSAEIYDPAIGTWSATASMINARADFPATRLNDGRVLVIGGGYDLSGSCCAEVFDPSATSNPSITVIAPNGGEAWLIGSTQTIRWSSQSVTGNVKIELSRDGGASYKQIANNVPNTGAFQWTVTKPATTQARIRVISIDEPAVQDTSNSVFRITR